jgi:hypothetical protein
MYVERETIAKSILGEAVTTACYVLNKCPTKRLNKVPEAIWNNSTPSVKHLRVFGSLCYTDTFQIKREKS